MFHQVLEMNYIDNIRFAGLAQVGVQPLEDGFQEVQMFVCLRNFGLGDFERLKELKRKVRAAGGKLKPTPFAKRNGFGLPVLSSDDE